MGPFTSDYCGGLLLQLHGPAKQRSAAAKIQSPIVFFKNPSAAVQR